jgi:hypothetical protein
VIISFFVSNPAILSDTHILSISPYFMAPSRVSDELDVLREIHVQAQNVPRKDATGYSIPDSNLGVRRPIKVLIIGFGAAAINLVHILGQRADRDSNISIQCYEKNPEVGGTWYENKYPGCACDIVRPLCDLIMIYKSAKTDFFCLLACGKLSILLALKTGLD